jgi:processive 1,2-diacylglycerol beta-glucosyltransferase
MRQTRKILILSCHGGGGHMAVAMALEQYLPYYTVTTIDLLGKSFASIDPFYLITRKYTGQDVYNFLLQHNAKRLANFLFKAGNFFRPLYHHRLKPLIDKEIIKHNPDVVISIIPMVNDVIIASAQALGKKTLIIPTDFDVTTFLNTIKNINPRETHICISLHNHLITNTIPDAIPTRALRFTGFPIRPGFFTLKDKAHIKIMHHIPVDVPIIMIIMGAAGSIATLRYMETLTHITSKPLHIIICIGRALFLKEHLLAIQRPASITITIIDHTHTIADFMAIADVCITKPGSVTFAELLYMEVPLILDQTSPTLLWERLNITITQHYKIGTVITNINDIIPLVTNYLHHPETLQAIKVAFKAIKRPLFHDHVYEIIEEFFISHEHHSKHGCC